MMQKKSLAALVATLFAVPFAAHADVTIYGFLSSGLESTKAVGNPTAANNYDSRTRVTDNNSRIGFKGFEDLGDGTKAIWQLESSLKNFEQGGTSDSGATATLGTRNSFVGLNNTSFGQIIAGYNDSAYKTLTGVEPGLNQMINTTADVNGAGQVFSRGEARLKNAVQYNSPVWSGFKFAASYGFDEAEAQDTNGLYTDRAHISLAGQYNANGLIVAAGWDRTEDSAVSVSSGLVNTATANTGYKTVAYSGKNQDYSKLAATYKFTTGTFIGAGYEHASLDQNNASGALTQNDWTVAFGQDFGAASLKLSYSELGSLNGLSNPDAYKAKQWTLAGTYNLSKATQLFAYYTKITNNADQAVNFANNPVYSNNLGQSSAYLSNGNDPQAFGVGLTVNF